MYFKIQNLTKDFGNIKAVKKFSLEVSKGELVSLLSPSGCKKRPVSTVFQNYTLSKKSLIDKANKMLDTKVDLVIGSYLEDKDQFKNLLAVNSVNVSIVKKALRYKHLYIYYLW